MKTNFVPHLSRPCAQDWQKMAGDRKRRFCEGCQLQVHNLSEMSHEEQRALLAKPQGRVCVAFFASEDSIRIPTGTWLLLQRLLRPWRAGLAFALMLLPAGLTGCVTTSRPENSAESAAAKHDCKEVRQPWDGKKLLPVGEFVPDRPRWQRVLFFWE